MILIIGGDKIETITDFLNHNTMYHFKKEAKRKNIPLICSKRSINSISESYEQRGLNEVD